MYPVAWIDSTPYCPVGVVHTKPISSPNSLYSHLLDTILQVLSPCAVESKCPDPSKIPSSIVSLAILLTHRPIWLPSCG